MDDDDVTMICILTSGLLCLTTPSTSERIYTQSIGKTISEQPVPKAMAGSGGDLI
jgi:hypothetical protein